MRVSVGLCLGPQFSCRFKKLLLEISIQREGGREEGQLARGFGVRMAAITSGRKEVPDGHCRWARSLARSQSLVAHLFLCGPTNQPLFFLSHSGWSRNWKSSRVHPQLVPYLPPGSEFGAINVMSCTWSTTTLDAPKINKLIGARKIVVL